MFSGDKTIVAFGKNTTLHAVAGTRTMTMRTEDVKRHAPLMSETISFGNRSAFLLRNDAYASKKEIPITKIVLVRLNDGVEECIKLEPSHSLHTLYAYFLDTVNADTILCGGNAVFSGVMPASSQEYLSNSLSKALHKIPAYTVSGSLPLITRTISHL